MKFLIADDHAIVRKGLIELLRQEFLHAEIREASNGTEVLDKISGQVWDLILLDISMPGKNGMETLKQLRNDGVNYPILMLSMQPEDQYALRVLKAGASGFVNKDSATDELIAAVHQVLSGSKYITPSMAGKLAAGNSTVNEPHELLSDREMQVLQLIASGKTVSEIADTVSLSVNTINTYRARILEKIELKSNAEITRYAFDNELV